MAGTVVHSSVSFVIVLIAIVVLIPTSYGQLSPTFYDNSCPQALPAIETAVGLAIGVDPRNGASLLRLHFHDCFVRGCDASLLLDTTTNFTSEKEAPPNVNSVKAMDVVDAIKVAVDLVCQGSVVSCADILAIAARDAVAILGGQRYQVQLGRRDSLTSYFSDVIKFIPAPSFNYTQLVSSFQTQGLGKKDLVVLSGGHTIGLAKCSSFQFRIDNDTDIDANYATSLKNLCSGNGNTTAPLDGTPTQFDSVYYQYLVQKKGLLHSDQQLLSGGDSESINLVTSYATNQTQFWVDFGSSMINMGNLNPLTGTEGEIRKNCRIVN